MGCYRYSTVDKNVSKKNIELTLGSFASPKFRQTLMSKITPITITSSDKTFPSGAFNATSGLIVIKDLLDVSPGQVSISNHFQGGTIIYELDVETLASLLPRNCVNLYK